MNKKIVIILSIVALVTLVTLATAKPLSKLSTPSQLRKLIKRATVGSEGSSKTGFALVTTAEQAENHKKTKDCKKWEKVKVTGQWKCMDLRTKWWKRRPVRGLVNNLQNIMLFDTFSMFFKWSLRMESSMSDHCDKEPIKESILLRPFLIFLFKHTGKSYSEALILASVNPQHDKRLFIEIPKKYKYRTCSVQILFWISKQTQKKTQFLYTTCCELVFFGE